MSRGTELSADPFEPLHRGRRAKLVLAFLFGPVLWFGALIVALFLIKHTNAIEIGLLISFGMFVVSSVVLIAIYAGRRRQEARERRR
jgi:membrane protein implicated in regulation of membrane protease activity